MKWRRTNFIDGSSTWDSQGWLRRVGSFTLIIRRRRSKRVSKYDAFACTSINNGFIKLSAFRYLDAAKKGIESEVKRSLEEVLEQL